jgi:hypothetical protein
LIVSWNETNLKSTFTTGKEEEIIDVSVLQVGKIKISKKNRKLYVLWVV